VAEIRIDGGDEVLPMLVQGILELHQVAAPLRKRGRTVAQEGGALPDQGGGQCVISLRGRPGGHGSLLRIEGRSTEGVSH